MPTTKQWSKVEVGLGFGNYYVEVLQVDVVINYSMMAMRNKHLPKNLRDYQVKMANILKLFWLFI